MNSENKCGGCPVKSSCGTPKSCSCDSGILSKNVDRREMLKMLTTGASVATAAANSFIPINALFGSKEEQEKAKIDMQEFFKTNYRQMTPEERSETVARLERRYKLQRDLDVKIANSDAQPDVLYGYAFNISKCKGYRECIKACLAENNQDSTLR